MKMSHNLFMAHLYIKSISFQEHLKHEKIFISIIIDMYIDHCSF